MPFGDVPFATDSVVVECGDVMLFVLVVPLFPFDTQENDAK